MTNKNFFYRSGLAFIVLFASLFFTFAGCQEKKTSDDEVDVEIRLTPPNDTDPLDVSDVYVILENVRTGHKDSALSVACQPLMFNLTSGSYNIHVHGKKVEGKMIAIYAGVALRVAFAKDENYTIALEKSYVQNPDWVEGSVVTSIQVLLPPELAALSPEGIVVSLKETTTQKVVTAVTNARGIADFTVLAGNYVADCSGELVKGKEDTRYYGHREQIVVGNESTVHQLQLRALGGESGDGESAFSFNLKLPDDYSSYSFDGVTVALQKMGSSLTYEFVCDANGKASIASLPHGLYALQGQVSVLASDGIRSYVCKIPYTEIQHVKVSAGTELPTPTIVVTPSFMTSALVFKEVYFTKSLTATGEMYNEDGYVELYNNSSRPIYIDGVSVCETYQNTKIKNGGFFPEYLGTDYVVPGFIFTFPGSGKEHRLDPGQSVIMAENAVNHHAINPGSPVDLSTADYEMKDDDWHDSDTPEVPNMINYFTYSKTVTSFHNRGWKGWFIMKADKPMPDFLAEHIKDAVYPNGSSTKIYVIPSRYVLDGIISAPPSGPLCRPLPVYIDAGYTYCTKKNIAKTIRRKVARKEGSRYILQDTNNSTLDFIPDATPSPRVVVE